MTVTMHRLIGGALVAVVSASFVAPALAADQTVAVDSANLFSSARVAVRPGDTVTWSNPGTFENHNVRFEDGQFSEPSTPAASFTVARKFLQDGAYRYYCEVHGAPGGTGMSGVIYVNATGQLPPEAQFTASPNPAVAGQTVTFDATTSNSLAGGITRYEWDLDGDGRFELDTGTTPSTSRSYPTAQDLTVKLRVTDGRPATDERTRPLRIDAAAAPAPDPQPDSAPRPVPAPQPPTAAAAPVLTPPSFSPVTPIVAKPKSTTTVKRKPGACSRLKGKKRAACITRKCRRLKGAKRRACVKKVTRRR